MATRSPTLQDRSNFHRNWGNFASESLLPNAAGAPLPAAQFVLEAGDLAYVSTIGLVYCEDAGSIGGGDAVWRRSDTRIYRAGSFSTLNHWEGAGGDLPGTGTMTAAVWVRHRTLLTIGTDIYFMGTYRRFAGGGWAVGLDSVRPVFIITDGGGNVINSVGAGSGWQGNAQAGSTTDTRDYGALTDALYHLTYDGTTLSGYINGTLIRSIAAVSAGFTASGVAPILGGIRDNAGNPVQPFDGAIAGAAYAGGAVFTEQQVLDHTLACFEANRFVDGGAGFDNMYSLDGYAAAPDPLPDLLGAVDLSRVGTPSMERTPARFL